MFRWVCFWVCFQVLFGEILKIPKTQKTSKGNQKIIKKKNKPGNRPRNRPSGTPRQESAKPRIWLFFDFFLIIFCFCFDYFLIFFWAFNLFLFSFDFLVWFFIDFFLIFNFSSNIGRYGIVTDHNDSVSIFFLRGWAPLINYHPWCVNWISEASVIIIVDINEEKYLSLKLLSAFLKHKKGLWRYVYKVTKEHLYKRYKILIFMLPSH